MSQPSAPSIDVLRQHCKALCLPTAYQIVEQALDTARQEDWPLETLLHYMLEQELIGRRQRRAERSPPLTRNGCRCVCAACSRNSVVAS